MRTLTKDLAQKIEVWLAPLPQNMQDLVWEAILTTARAGTSFNPQANDFSELLLWHLSPAGSFFWETIHQTTEYFWKAQLDQLNEAGRPAFRKMQTPEHIGMAA